MSNSSGSVVPLIGRVLISQIFILSGINKIVNFSMMLGYVNSAHLPLPKIALGCAAAIEILGGLAVLTGFHTKLASWILFLFLIPTTFLFHNFWAMLGAERMDNMGHFQKNLAIMGGLLILATLGAGAYSIDSSRAPKA
ncbi:MAG TPA: DoxX family protein [Candidatus Acidoferrales bacterium]|nr:DoxX family protein [Candidatus Acidoferrales bacterium]